MKNEDKKAGNILSQQGYESMDVFGGFSFYAWSSNTDDYKLIAEALDLWSPVQYTMEALSYVNKYIKDDKYIFDGTVGNLKFLVKNNLLDIDNIKEFPHLTGLKDLLKKYLKPTIEDIFDELQDGLILRDIIFKYPKYWYLLDYTSQGAKLRELLPKDETKFRELFGLNENYEEEVPMSSDRWSPQAMKCKVVLIGLYLKAGKLSFSANCKKTIEVMSTLSEKDVEECNEDKLVVINSMWSGLTGQQPWNKKRSITFQQLLRKDLLLINIDGSDLNLIYKNFLYPLVKEVSDKYYDDFDKHPAFLAIMNATVVILHRLMDFTKQGKRHSKLRLDGILNKSLEYIFTEDFKLQDWFIKHFKEELEKRIRIINLMDKVGARIKLVKNEAIVYMPILESFRFYIEISRYYIPYIIKIFRAKDISFDDKNEVIKPIVFNIQRIIALGEKDTDKWENKLKEDFSVLMLNIFDPLIRSTASISAPKQKLFDKETIYDTLKTEVFLSILKYDSVKNPNFFGYIKTILPFQLKTELRENKTNASTQTITQLSNKFGIADDPDKLEGFMDSIFGSDKEAEKLIELINNESEIKKALEIIESLPPAEKEAIKKAYIRNEKLSDTERKAKNRGLKKARNLIKE